VKRKFRVPGQTFADSISALITFIEAHPMVRASELAPKFLGISALPPPKPAETSAPAPTEKSSTGDTSQAPASAPAAEAPRPEPNLSLDERAKISRLQGDLLWLVHEGYVTEFIDGRLFAPPPMVEARKKEIENEEHDPENFPEAPPATEAPAHIEHTSPAPESPTEPASDSSHSAVSGAESAAPDVAPPESHADSGASSDTPAAAETEPEAAKKAEPPAPAASS
jgi:hypothetical protein